MGRYNKNECDRHAEIVDKLGISLTDYFRKKFKEDFENIDDRIKDCDKEIEKIKDEYNRSKEDIEGEIERLKEQRDRIEREEEKRIEIKKNKKRKLEELKEKIGEQIKEILDKPKSEVWDWCKETAQHLDNDDVVSNRYRIFREKFDYDLRYEDFIKLVKKMK